MQAALEARLEENDRENPIRIPVRASDGTPIPEGTPVVEHEELFTRKAGEEIVAQLYHFELHDRTLALRPEITPSVARMVGARRGALRAHSMPAMTRCPIRPATSGSRALPSAELMA